MAEVITYVCDREHEERVPAERMDVRLDDGTYRIDLCPAHRQELETLQQMLAEFVAAGQLVDEPDVAEPGATPSTRRHRDRSARRPSDSAERQENIAIRTWAREHGIEVSERGRIPDRVKEQYRASTSTLRPPPGRAFVDAQVRREAEASVALDRDQTHEVGPVTVGDRP